MKKLHQLAKELKANNFEMTESIKEQFEEFLSIIAEGSRILHPRFGLGTVKRTQGNTWVVVEFDKDNNSYKEQLEKYNNLSIDVKHLYNYRKPSVYERAVHIASCYSVHMLLKNEYNNVKPL